ncbi:MAG: hypothetical protein K2W95_31690 [Candidatus Obscuribacterales bacterium]|nr:hypothetical protein [Candidatus Obscuribacterales bacterium]
MPTRPPTVTCASLKSAACLVAQQPLRKIREAQAQRCENDPIQVAARALLHFSLTTGLRPAGVALRSGADPMTTPAGLTNVNVVILSRPPSGKDTLL